MTTEVKELTIREPVWAAPRVPLPIRSHEDYVEVADSLKSVKGFERYVDTEFNPRIEEAHRTWKGLTEWRKRVLAPAKAWEAECKSTMAAWDTEQERLRQEEQRRLEAEARRQEEARLLAEAAALEAEGIAEADEGKLAEAERLIEGPVETPVITVEKATPQIQGISYRTNYSAVLVDLLALCRHVAQHPEHQELLALNQTAANQLARSLKENMKVPGLRVRVDKVVAAR